MTEVFSEKDRFVAKLRGGPVGKDIFGNELYVGDYIVYGSMSGSSARLKTGRIVRVNVRKPGPYARAGEEPKISVTVRAVTKNYNWQTKTSSWEAASTTGTLQNLSSNVVLWKDPDPIAVAALGNLDV